MAKLQAMSKLKLAEFVPITVEAFDRHYKSDSLHGMITGKTLTKTVAIETVVENNFSVLIVKANNQPDFEVKVISPPGLSKCCYYMSIALHLIANSHKCND